MNPLQPGRGQHPLRNLLDWLLLLIAAGALIYVLDRFP